MKVIGWVLQTAKRTNGAHGLNWKIFVNSEIFGIMAIFLRDFCWGSYFQYLIEFDSDPKNGRIGAHRFKGNDFVNFKFIFEIYDKK